MPGPFSRACNRRAFPAWGEVGGERRRATRGKEVIRAATALQNLCAGVLPGSRLFCQELCQGKCWHKVVEGVRSQRRLLLLPRASALFVVFWGALQSAMCTSLAASAQDGGVQRPGSFVGVK